MPGVDGRVVVLEDECLPLEGIQVEHPVQDVAVGHVLLHAPGQRTQMLGPIIARQSGLNLERLFIKTSSQAQKKPLAKGSMKNICKKAWKRTSLATLIRYSRTKGTMSTVALSSTMADNSPRH